MDNNSFNANGSPKFKWKIQSLIRVELSKVQVNLGRFDFYLFIFSKKIDIL